MLARAVNTAIGEDSNDTTKVATECAELPCMDQLDEESTGENTTKVATECAKGSDNVEQVCRVSSIPTFEMPPQVSHPRGKRGLIEEMQDALPQYRESFLELCLIHFDWDLHRAINAVVDNTLPPKLQYMDRRQKFI